MLPIVPPASPIALATRPSMPGRWSIRTRSVSENWAEVVGSHAPGYLAPSRPYPAAALRSAPAAS